MSGLAALIPTDLSRIDLLRNGGPGEHWIAAPVGEAPDADALRRRVSESTVWCARQCGTRRLTAVLDVHEAGCRWVHTPSAAPAVVAASLRNQGEEWASVAPVGGIEPLVADSGNGTAADHLVAITMPDALARLWLDGLDRLGARVSNVVTLWHAAALAWSDADAAGLQAIILVDDAKRLVWAWAEDGALVVGGQVRLGDRTARPGADTNHTSHAHSDALEAAAARLALDWVTWSTQLGRSPTRVKLVGANAAPGLDRALTTRLSTMSIQRVDDPDAIVATLRKVDERAQAPAGAPSATRCLTRLTQRPSRRLRWSYRLWGAALLALSAGMAVVGARTWGMAGAWTARTAEVRTALTDRVRHHFGDEYQPQPGQSPLTWLMNMRGMVGTEDSSTPPPAPRPIHETTSSLLAIIAQTENEPKLAKLRLSQADGDNYIQLRGLDTSATYTFVDELRQTSIPMTWTPLPAPRGATNLTVRINGVWNLQGGQ